jgi:hypothetical protein
MLTRSPFASRQFADTLFAIGPCSKAFGASALDILVDVKGGEVKEEIPGHELSHRGRRKRAL